MNRRKRYVGLILHHPRGKGTRWISPPLISGLTILTVFAVGTFVQRVSPLHDPEQFHIGARLQGPSFNYWLGTDEFGRDLLARTLTGATFALPVATLATGIAMTVGTLFGVVSARRGTWPDEILSRLNDTIYVVPTILMAMLLATVWGPGIFPSACAIAFGLVPMFFRLGRAKTLSIQEEPFIEAALAMGIGEWRIIAHYIVPAMRSSLFSLAAMSTAIALLADASLSYIGLGIAPPAPTWGRMLYEAQSYVGLSVWPVLIPGATLLLLTLAFNMIATALE